MAHASTDRSVGPRSGGGSAAADLNGSFAAGDGVVDASRAMTPAAALARHVEWLDFALGAATAEERWRRERLAKATKGNRAKRTDRLAEVVAEIEELTALLTGIRDLERRDPPASTARRRGRPPGSKNGTGKRFASGASAATKAPSTGRRRTTSAKAPAPAAGSAANAVTRASTATATTPTARRKRSTPTTAG